MSILQQIVGYDEIVNFLTEFIVNGLPMIEDAAKIALCESLKDLFSCSINPLLSENLIRRGVVFDLSSIDLLNIMDRCPLSNTFDDDSYNLFFYSDVKDFSIPDQLVKCKDLNAVIWYVKQRSYDRVVWYGYQTQSDEHEDLTIDSKPSAKDGVITLEYSEKSSYLKDCENNDMDIQVPSNNCLHVFLGNTKGVTSTYAPEPSSDKIVVKTDDFKNLIANINSTLPSLEEKYKNANKISSQSETKNEIDILNEINDAIKNDIPISSVFPDMLVDPDTKRRYFIADEKRIMMDEYTYQHSKKDLEALNKELIENRTDRIETYNYRTPEQNYYYHKTLFEFNTDYIMSVKFFDSKVIISQIINILTGCLNASLNMSFEESLIRNEVERMLTMIIENDTNTVVNDCFFTFTNEEYNQLIDKTEKERLGKYTGGVSAYGSYIPDETIRKEMATIVNSNTASDQIKTTNNALNEISRAIKPEFETPSDTELTVNLSVNFDFLNNLLRGLTQALVYSIISPKIYLLMAINFKVMGKEPNFDLSTFIEKFKSLLINAIRGITNRIMESLKEWMFSILGDLVIRLADRLMFEQAQYYIKLLMKCIRACARLYGSAGNNWNMANVEYADIYEDENNIETNTSCN